ncbi:MAG: hypothetical protein PHZ09_13135, partial [Eubacteriales bacterium]|nr:hypothetical protein [Eubacteriales bacterium]
MDKYGLTDRPKEELTAIIEKLMGQLKYEERIEFLAQWISPQAALDEAGEGDGVRFLEKVRAFCDKCADGEYYHGYDEDYYGDEDYYSSYNNYDSQYKKYKNNKYYDEDEDDYGDFNATSKEWANQFVSFFKLAVIYSKNRDYATAFTAFAALTDCIYRTASDEEIFGTNNPTYYIKTDWDELFAEYFVSMKNMLPDAGQRADSAIEIWTRFPEYCGDLVMNAFDEIACAEQAIRSRIAGLTDEWFAQHSLYELLTRFYVRFGLEFDEVETAKSMVRYNPIFKSELVRGYMNRGMWDEAILTIGEA